MENAKDEKEVESIFKKLESIDDKARKLSEADQEIYEEELGRLARW